MKLKVITFFFSSLLILQTISVGNIYGANNDHHYRPILRMGVILLPTNVLNSRPISEVFIDFGRDKPFNECNNRIDAYSHPRGIDDSFDYILLQIFILSRVVLIIKEVLLFDLGKKLIDEAGTPNTIIHLGSLFDGTFIGNTKTIGPGMYDVVYDLCQEEILDSEDGLMEDALEVKWIKNFQSTGLDVWKSDKVERLKASAEKTAAALLALKILWKTVIIFGAIKQLA